MPELPEVETVRRILNSFLPGNKINDVIVNKKGIINGDVELFKQTLIGQTFGEIQRKGKQLILTFESDIILLSHLRMEGKYIEVMPGQSLSKYAHVIFDLGNNHFLCYDDSRQFGKMELSTKSTYLSTKTMLNIGSEPFDIDKTQYFKALKKRNGLLKPLLLDQKLMSGLGNIYVDEVLFLSKLSPIFPTNKLTQNQVNTIVDNSILVLQKAIKEGGTTIRSYHPALGISGNFQQSLNIYGKALQNCPNCNHKFKKIFVKGRGTTYCPHCQHNPYRPYVVAITGQKAAGKSVIMNHLQAQGHSCYQADILAKDLYKDPEVVAQLSQKIDTNLMLDGMFSTSLLREYLIANPLKVKIVNAFIHPLVKDKIINIIENSNASIIYFEIPLVFSLKINELCDYIIGVETSKAQQEVFLALRGETLGLNPDAMYQKNRHQLDYIIVNDGSVNELINKFEKFKV